MSVTEQMRRQVEEAMGDLERWHHDCHAASVRLVRARVLPNARVARGACIGVGGQHSWVVVGHPYEPELIIDPTLWSYDPEVEGIEYAGRKAQMKRWQPKGRGVIWQYGCPQSGGGEEIVLAGLSAQAETFLEMCRDTSEGPLDRQFWGGLFNGPMVGWPAAEILAAADDDPRLAALIPIDVLGMLTDRNPEGLYLPVDETEGSDR